MIYNFDLFKKYGNLFTAFSQKNNGSMKLSDNSELAEKITPNRNNYFLKNNTDSAKVVSAGIVHGSKVAIVDEKDCGKIVLGTDGLLSQEKNLFLSITSADCLPIFLFDPKNKVIGIIHAGWRSLAENILTNAVEKIKKLGGAPEDILVGIGPAICQKHYEVGPEVAEKFSEYPSAILKENNKIFLDLKKIAQLQLLDLRLKNENIEISPECNFELPKKYFSARRDKKKEIETMIAVIGMKNIVCVPKRNRTFISSSLPAFVCALDRNRTYISSSGNLRPIH
ncbi:MAG: peptidoglycan editing factor PgeF [Candidatus Moranbacteria bacterium CG_4_8_14_3_um_filter_43_15]|nr:MAG: peptidoglycan editing factor PgeF [Candidatus Moranbacteria bacterium CG_4_8_14_3_um_filter_43_15]